MLTRVQAQGESFLTGTTSLPTGFFLPSPVVIGGLNRPRAGWADHAIA
jgi:hypothetical protein